MHSRSLTIALWLLTAVIVLGAGPSPVWQPSPAEGAPAWAALDDMESVLARLAAPPGGVDPLERVAGQRLAVCQPPAAERQLPERTSELRLARDANGDYWQIQSGCRHRVVPQAMDPAALRTIPLADDVSFIAYTLPALAPTPAPLPAPAYAQVPLWLLPEAEPRPPAPAVPPSSPGFLQGYTEGVLVFDPADTNTVYLLAGGLRHRVLVFYPYCVIYPAGLPRLCQPTEEGVLPDLARGGDPTAQPPFPYLLRRRVDADCSDLFPGLRMPRPVTCASVYEELFFDVYRRLGLDEDESRARARNLASEAAGFVANIDEIPLGEPAPYYGWGRGESNVLSGRGGMPDARPCRPRVAGTTTAQADACSTRFDNAQQITIEQYLKDPTLFEGSDVRLTGVACGVRFNRNRNVVTFTIGRGTSAVQAVAPGRRAQQDPNLVDNAVLDVAASVTPQGEQGAGAGELVVFEYTRTGTGTCRRTEAAT